MSPLQATDAGGGVTGVSVPAGSTPTIVQAPRDPDTPPDHFMWRYCVSMLMDKKDGVWCLSIGRVLLITLFVHAVVVWSMGTDIQEHEMHTLWGMLGYVFSSKVTQLVADVKGVES